MMPHIHAAKLQESVDYWARHAHPSIKKELLDRLRNRKTGGSIQLELRTLLIEWAEKGGEESEHVEAFLQERWIYHINIYLEEISDGPKFQEYLKEELGKRKKLADWLKEGWEAGLFLSQFIGPKARSATQAWLSQMSIKERHVLVREAKERLSDDKYVGVALRILESENKKMMGAANNLRFATMSPLDREELEQIQLTHIAQVVADHKPGLVELGTMRFFAIKEGTDEFMRNTPGYLSRHNYHNVQKLRVALDKLIDRGVANPSIDQLVQFSGLGKCAVKNAMGVLSLLEAERLDDPNNPIQIASAPDAILYPKYKRIVDQAIAKLDTLVPHWNNGHPGKLPLAISGLTDEEVDLGFACLMVLNSAFEDLDARQPSVQPKSNLQWSSVEQAITLLFPDEDCPKVREKFDAWLDQFHEALFQFYFHSRNPQNS